MHVFVQPQGIKPCCSYQEISTQSIQEFWHSPALSQINISLANGTPVKNCSGCHRNELVSGASTRTEANAEWSEYNKQPHPIYFDLRFSNVCNFKCRSCDADFSSLIDAETQRWPELVQYYRAPTQNKSQQLNQSTVDYIINILPNIKLLRFAGGEPTHMPEVKRLLEKIIADNLTQIDIQITTNGSFQKEFWHDMIKRLPRMHWTLSLDAIGAHAEIVRHGTNWNKILKNFEFLAANSHSLLVNTTVSNLNVMQLEPLIELVDQQRDLNRDQRNGVDHMFQLVSNPLYLVPWNLPSELRDRADQRIEKILQRSMKSSNRDLFLQLKQSLQQQAFDPELWQRSLEFNQTLDRIRQQDHTDCFV